MLALARAAATAFAAVLTEAGRETSFFLAGGVACFFVDVRDLTAGRWAALVLATGREATLALGWLFVGARARFLTTFVTFFVTLGDVRPATFFAALGLFAVVLRAVFPPFPAGLLFRFVDTAAFLML
ncbi:MAG: hypothetical protein ACREP2_03820 [Rhodanobacteraceae bacterium]